MRHLEARAARASDERQRAGRRGQPAELGRRVRRVAAVVQVVGMNGIEKAIRSLSRETKGEGRGLPHRPSEHRRPLSGRVASRGGLHVAQPGVALARQGPNLDDATRLESKLGRHVPDQHVDRFDHLRVWRDAVRAVHPLVHRHAVDDIEKSVIDTARVHQPVVFGRPSGRGGNRILQAATADAHRRAPHGIARQRGSRRGCDRLIRLRRHVDLFGERGRQRQFERNRQRIGDGEHFHDRSERRRFGFE